MRIIKDIYSDILEDIFDNAMANGATDKKDFTEIIHDNIIDENNIEDNFFSGRGLCTVMKNGGLCSAGDVSMVPIGKARDASLNMKGFVWLMKFYPILEKVTAYVDKTQMKVNYRLKLFINHIK